MKSSTEENTIRTYLIQYNTFRKQWPFKSIKQCKEFLPTMGVGNKIKNSKKILINQAEKGYGVSDHYVNSMIILRICIQSLWAFEQFLAILPTKSFT